MKKHIIFLAFLLALVSLQFLYNKAPKVYMVGDSTMADKPLVDNPERGWGQLLPLFFKSDVEFENHARNGRSTKSFINEGLWKAVYDKLEPGDYVFIQFGHNDQKDYDTSRYAAPHTDYKNNLIRFVEDTRSKGTFPVLLTPINRRKFDDNGNLVDTHGEYPDVVREVAEEYEVPLIDLHKSSMQLLTSLGPEKSKELYMWIEPGKYKSLPEGKEDNTHFTVKGAVTMANLATDELKNLDVFLKNYLDETPDVYELGKEKVVGVISNMDIEDVNVIEVTVPVFPDNEFNIIDFGAVGDGLTKNTEAFADAIEACSEAGGGKVIVPPGMWFTGPITFKSNVDLYLEQGAFIQFSGNFDDYPLVETSFEGTPQYRATSPLNGKNLENIAITGFGVIDGAGENWRPVKKYKMIEDQWKELLATGGVVDEKNNIWWPTEDALNAQKYLEDLFSKKENPTKEDFESIKEYLRPVMLSFVNCKNILLDGPTFQNSPAWNLHPLMCENLTVRNINVRNPWYSQNGDGIDVESCKNAVIYNCKFDVGDDAICIKSGRNEYGRERGIPSENIVIADCIVYHGHGGFTVGSEMSGGVRNIKVSNCNFIGTDVGLRFKSTRGRGGVVENIYINNIYMKEIPTRALSFNMFYGGMAPTEMAAADEASAAAQEVEVSEETPVFRKIYIKNIYCTGAEDAVVLQGLPEMPISDIELDNVIITSEKGISIYDADGIKIVNSRFDTEKSPVVFVLQGRNILLNNVKYDEDTDTFIRVAGYKSANITLKNCGLTINTDKIEMSKGADINCLIID